MAVSKPVHPVELGYGVLTSEHVKTCYQKTPTVINNIDTTSATRLTCSGSCNPMLYETTILATTRTNHLSLYS